MKQKPNQFTIPIVAEEVKTAKRRVSGAFRVKKRMKEHRKIVEQPLVHERLEVHRVSKHQVVEGTQPVRDNGDTVIIPLVKQVLSIQKHWVLTEEIHVSRKRVTEPYRESVTLQYEDVEIERSPRNTRRPVHSRGEQNNPKPEGA